jgi:hypothetical protein
MFLQGKRSFINKGRSGAGDNLFLGSGGLLLGGPFLNDTIVFCGALDAIANLFSSWIVSHRRQMMGTFPPDRK